MHANQSEAQLLIMTNKTELLLNDSDTTSSSCFARMRQFYANIKLNRIGQGLDRTRSVILTGSAELFPFNEQKYQPS